MLNTAFDYDAPPPAVNLPLISLSYGDEMPRLVRRPKTFQDLTTLATRAFHLHPRKPIYFYIPAAYFQFGEDTEVTEEVWDLVRDHIVRIAVEYEEEAIVGANVHMTGIQPRAAPPPPPAPAPRFRPEAQRPGHHTVHIVSSQSTPLSPIPPPHDRLPLPQHQHQHQGFRRNQHKVEQPIPPRRDRNGNVPQGEHELEHGHEPTPPSPSPSELTVSEVESFEDVEGPLPGDSADREDTPRTSGTAAAAAAGAVQPEYHVHHDEVISDTRQVILVEEEEEEEDKEDDDDEGCVNVLLDHTRFFRDEIPTPGPISRLTSSSSSSGGPEAPSPPPSRPDLPRPLTASLAAAVNVEDASCSPLTPAPPPHPQAPLGRGIPSPYPMFTSLFVPAPKSTRPTGLNIVPPTISRHATTNVTAGMRGRGGRGVGVRGGRGTSTWRNAYTGEVGFGGGHLNVSRGRGTRGGRGVGRGRAQGSAAASLADGGEVEESDVYMGGGRGGHLNAVRGRGGRGMRGVRGSMAGRGVVSRRVEELAASADGAAAAGGGGGRSGAGEMRVAGERREELGRGGVCTRETVEFGEFADGHEEGVFEIVEEKRFVHQGSSFFTPPDPTAVPLTTPTCGIRNPREEMANDTSFPSRPILDKGKARATDDDSTTQDNLTAGAAAPTAEAGHNGVSGGLAEPTLLAAFEKMLCKFPSLGFLHDYDDNEHLVVEDDQKHDNDDDEGDVGMDVDIDDDPSVDVDLDEGWDETVFFTPSTRRHTKSTSTTASTSDSTTTSSASTTSNISISSIPGSHVDFSLSNLAQSSPRPGRAALRIEPSLPAMHPHRSRTDGTSTRPQTQFFSPNADADGSSAHMGNDGPPSTAQAPLTADIPSASASSRSSSPQDAPPFSAIPSIATEASPWPWSARKRGFSDAGVFGGAGGDGRAPPRARMDSGVDVRAEGREEGEVTEAVEDGQSAIVEGGQCGDLDVDQPAQKDDGKKDGDQEKQKQPEEGKVAFPDHDELEDVKQKDGGDEDGGEYVSVRHPSSDRVVYCTVKRDDLVEALITEVADKLGVESWMHKLMMKFKYVDDDDTVVNYSMECQREETMAVAGIGEGCQLELVDFLSDDESPGNGA